MFVQKASRNPSIVALELSYACRPRQRRWRPLLLLSRTKVLTVESMNQNIVNLQYAVRGPLVARAAEIEAELAKVGVL